MVLKMDLKIVSFTFSPLQKNLYRSERKCKLGYVMTDILIVYFTLLCLLLFWVFLMLIVLYTYFAFVWRGLPVTQVAILVLCLTTLFVLLKSPLSRRAVPVAQAAILKEVRDRLVLCPTPLF